MERISRYLICFIYAFLLAGGLFAQERSDNDILLDRYELACRDCLELKSKARNGEKVTRKDATEHLNMFVALNSVIKTCPEPLTCEQKIRFDAVNQWFATGTRPMVLDHENIPQVIALKMPGVRQMQEDLYLAETCRDISDDVERIPVQEKRFRTYLTAIISAPNTAYGGMVGLRYDEWGGYVRFKCRFASAKPSYSCTSDGQIDESGMTFWPGEKTGRTTLTAIAGVLWGFSDRLCLYGGLGYGKKSILWEDIDGSWAQVSDLSFKGLSAEAGILASWKFMTIGLGVSTTAFHSASIDISAGFCF